MPMNFSRRAIMLGVLAATALTGTSSIALAQSNWPGKAVTIVVPYPPGGSTDAIARAAANHLSTAFGQSFIVENHSGANGNIGAAYVAHSEDVETTFMITTNGPISNNALLYSSLSFDPLNDFAPIVQLVDLPLVVVAHPDKPYNNIEELVAYAKENPGLLSGNASLGAVGHLSSELLAHRAEIELTQIPYPGSGPLTNEVLGGHVDIAFDLVTSYLPHIANGSVKVLGVTSAEPVAQLPDAAPIQDQGVADYVATGFISAVGHKDMPAEIIEKLNAELNVFLESEAAQGLLFNFGLTPVGGTAEDLSNRIETEVNTWRPIIESVGISLQ